MARKDPDIEKIGEVLDKSLKRLELAPRLDEYGVWPVWNETVGPTIARNAQPEKIRHGTLFVKVASPVWMQQLQYMKEMISDKLNQRLGGGLVKNIFFVIGKIDADAADVEARPAPNQGARPDDPDLDESFLQSVQDPEIRQALKRLFDTYARRKRHADR